MPSFWLGLMLMIVFRPAARLAADLGHRLLASFIMPGVVLGLLGDPGRSPA
jgi:ABC-type dipeptide/oligopeptide/nickel transport system permease component